MDKEIASTTGATDQRQRGLTAWRITLTAGTPKSIEIKGDWFHVFKAPVNDLVLRFDDGEPHPVEEGIGERRYYSKVTAESATGQAIILKLGFGSTTDGRATANVNVTTNIAPGNTFDDGGDVVVPDSAATQLIAADPDRLYAKISLPSDALGPVRVGTAGVDLTSGELIEPGMSVPIACTAALYAYHENGADVTVVVSAVKEV